MKHLPNFITSLNLVSGFTAIIFAVQGELLTASWLILAGMIFDFLDGFSARLLNAFSGIGKELDSLADVVSFGVAPALILFYLISDSLSLILPMSVKAYGLKTLLVLSIPAIMPVCAALRLAIFNLDLSQKVTFKGLPTPANALAVISLIIASAYSDSAMLSFLLSNTLFLVVFTLILSILMITSIPLLSLKMSSLNLKGNEGRYFLSGAIIIGIILFGISSLPFLIPLYIVVSLMQFKIFDQRQ